MRRRAFLAGGAAAWLAAPLVARAATPEAVDTILGRSRLGDVTGFALVDAGSGAVLEAHRPEALLPPASVAKTVTTLYALQALGDAHRFRTEIRAAGPVEGGVLRGDLVLAGGGDPVLDTDALGDLVAALRVGGLARVEGRLLVADGALPTVPEIDGDQPEDAPYNPTISGINLDFNRVFFAWAPGKAGPKLTLSAEGERFAVPASGVRVELASEGLPRHRIEDGVEVWTMPRPGLAGRGSAWLPVRLPAVHAGEVFRALAGQAGLTLPEAEVVPTAGGAVMAVREGDALPEVLRAMLRYSTNLTAEVAGLTASGAPDLGASGAAMTTWARGRFGLRAAAYVNHSGLGDATRLTAAEQASVLAQAAEGPLPGLLPARPILDVGRKPVDLGVEVVSKTGTLDFASALAGYMTGRRRLAFAILSADMEARGRIRPEQRANPPGAAGWEARARAQQQALLRRWAALYG